MSRLTSEEKKALRLIASFYGCKVKFISLNDGGYFDGETNTIAVTQNSKRAFTVFCHELGHFKNFKTNKYPLYHNPKTFNRLRSFFNSYGQMIRYCLKAEIFTESVGREFMKEWFPRKKYKAYYVNSRYCYEFLYGYYLNDDTK